MAPPTARIFIADPALRDHRGHHFNLTHAMADALTQEGYRVICLVNRDFTPVPELHTVRCFDQDTYDAHRRRHQQQALTANGTATTAHRPTSAETPRADRLIAPSASLGLRLYRLLPISLRQHLTPALRALIGRGRNPNSTAPYPAAPSADKSVSTTAAAEQPAEQQLYAALCDYGLRSDDIVLFHTSDAHTYRDIANLYFDVVPPSRWNELPRFHLSTPFDEAIMPHNRYHPRMDRSIARLQGVGLLNRRVFLHAENDLLAEHLAAQLATTVTPLPIPATQLATPARVADDVCRIAYLGPARTEKGFPRLPGIVKGLLQTRPALNIEVVIQVTPQILGYTDDVQQAVTELRAIEDHRLTLIHEPLSRADYQQTLAAADVMVMLYDPERYRVRGSGIAVEAVLHQCTIVATPNTVPASLAGPAGVCVDAQACQTAVVATLQDLVATANQHRLQAAQRQQWYLEHHCAHAFANSLQQPGQLVEEMPAPGTHRYEDETEWQPLL